MAKQNGALLISRQRLTLAEGITSVDTGLTQVHLGLSPDPPLGGSDPTDDSNGIASRVQVTPLAPLAPWVTGNIHHTEPYLDATTGTVKVDFWVAPDTGEQTINVEFWDPHTKICPIDCDPYNVLSCDEVAVVDGNSQTTSSETLTLLNPVPGAGSLVMAYVAFRKSTGFDSADVITADDAGWTQLRTSFVDLGGGAGMQFAVFYRISADTDPATYDFSCPNGDPNGLGIAAYFSGVDITAAIQSDAAIVTENATSNPFSIDAPSLVAAEPLPTMICAFLVDSADTTWTVPGSMTEQISGQLFDSEHAMTMVIATEAILAVGATGTRQGDYAAEGTGGFAHSAAIQPQCGIFPGGAGMGVMGIMGPMED